MFYIAASAPVFLLLAALSNEACAAEPIELRREIVVSQDLVRLGDIFRGLAPGAAEVPVAQAPQPGETVELPPRWLLALAEARGLDWRPSSALDRARLTRASRLVEASEAVALLEAALNEGPHEILLDDPRLLLHLPLVEGARLELAGLSRDQRSGRFSASLLYLSRGLVLARAEITGRAFKLLEVPVLSRRLAAGTLVSESDLSWQRMRADRLGENSLLAEEAILGKSLRRSLPAGQPLRASDLGEPLLVTKNSLVTLQVKTPYMQLTAQGRALEDGAAGAVVRVMNTKSSTTVSGTVVAAGLVEVATATSLAAR